MVEYIINVEERIDMENKIWTLDEINEKLKSGNVTWIEHGVVAIFNKQTDTEKVIESTNYNNGVGYNGADAPIMSSFAKWLLKRKGNHLSTKQLAIAQKKIVKYSKQLTKIANGEI